MSLKKEEILGRTDTTTTGQEGIMQSSQGQITIKWSELYSESQCIKYWKKSRTNPSSNGLTRWWEILKSETETFIVNIIGIMAIQQRIAGVCGTTWTNQEGKLKQLLHHSSGLGGQTNSRSERETPSRPPLGTINVIFAAPSRIGSCPF